MKWQDKRLPWWAVGAGLAAFAIIAFILIQRQNNDLAMLERTYEAVNARRITLQSEQSEKQREYNISNSPEYIAARARENGYMMPNALSCSQCCRNPARMPLTAKPPKKQPMKNPPWK